MTKGPRAAWAAVSCLLMAEPALAQAPPPPLASIPPAPPGTVCNPPPSRPSQPPPPSNVRPYRPFPATWQKTLDGFVSSGEVPGAVVIVESPDWGVRVGVAGVANIATGEPMRPDQQFHIGSGTKAFMGQTILRLEQEGRLKLTDHVLDYLGDDPAVRAIPNIQNVTIANLLQMTSGVANYLESSTVAVSPQQTPDKAWTPSQLMAVLSPSATPKVNPDFAPGDTYTNPYWLTVLQKQPPMDPPPTFPSWFYSNSNYILLGMIAQKITGLPPETYIKREVFDVAGLPDTYFATGREPPPEIHGYTKFGPIPFPWQIYKTWCDVTAINPSYAWTAGAIVSTPWDLLKFEDTMFKTDKLLDAGTKNKWFTFRSADIHVGWAPMQYGMGGLMQAQRDYGTARGHGGAFPGYKTLIYYFADQDVSFVLATNSWDGESEVEMLDAIMPEVSSAVTTPRPSNDARLVAQAGKVRVGWQAGRVYGGAYDVYWGTNPDAVDRASEGSHAGVNLKSVNGLEAEISAAPGKTYYWRVDTVAAKGQALPLVIGPMWRFRT